MTDPSNPTITFQGKVNTEVSATLQLLFSGNVVFTQHSVHGIYYEMHRVGKNKKWDWVWKCGLVDMQTQNACVQNNSGLRETQHSTAHHTEAKLFTGAAMQIWQHNVSILIPVVVFDNLHNLHWTCDTFNNKSAVTKSEPQLQLQVQVVTEEERTVWQELIHRYQVDVNEQKK